MKRKYLVIGLGIGAVYNQQLSKGGDSVITVDADPTKSPNFLKIEDALANHKKFDVGIICTPNFLHEEMAYQIAPVCDVVVIEKPGLSSSTKWKKLIDNFPNKKILMTKNNLYRYETDWLKELVKSERKRITDINIKWINRDRVPGPGTWFTTKEKSFGGVSYDLLPHLLHFYYGILGSLPKPKTYHVSQHWTLPDVLNTEYGSSNPNGIYDVDDCVTLRYNHFNLDITLQAEWKSTLRTQDDRSICITFSDGSKITFDYELCPNPVYRRMIHSFMSLDRASYNEHKNLDLKVHRTLEEIK